MPRPARMVDSALRQKGFRSHAKDHVYYYLYVDGKKTAVRTKISHGEKEISDNLLSIMARQLKLSKQLFGDLIDCPMTGEEYIRRLREGGNIG